MNAELDDIRGWVDPATAIAVAGRYREAGQRVALANGCFDLLHVGHVRYLEGARALGDRLIVAINDDESVRSLKGAGRPILNAAGRATLVAALAVVDIAFVFSGDDVTHVLESIRPAVHVKGTDYTVDTVPERAAAQRLGIEVAIAGDPKDHSTRSLLAQLKATGA